jgi:phosphonate transport system ATP-binding protein
MKIALMPYGELMLNRLFHYNRGGCCVAAAVAPNPLATRFGSDSLSDTCLAMAQSDACSTVVSRAGSIEVENISRTFGPRKALDAISLSIESGEMVALLGASGAGKSTLLRHIAGLAPTDARSGQVRVGGRIVQSGGIISRDIRALRAGIGFIFQQFNLVDRLSLLTNVLVGHLPKMPRHRRMLGLFTRQEKLAAMRALSFVGLAEHASQRASTLSGGQQQRAAIARTIVQGAQVILADEPIASLDPESARLVMDELRQMNRIDGVTVVVSVHQIDHAKRSCDRVVALRDGRIYCDCHVEELTDERLGQLYGRSA